MASAEKKRGRSAIFVISVGGLVLLLQLKNVSFQLKTRHFNPTCTATFQHLPFFFKKFYCIVHTFLRKWMYLKCADEIADKNDVVYVKRNIYIRKID